MSSPNTDIVPDPTRFVFPGILLEAYDIQKIDLLFHVEHCKVFENFNLIRNFHVIFLYTLEE